MRAPLWKWLLAALKLGSVEEQAPSVGRAFRLATPLWQMHLAGRSCEQQKHIVVPLAAGGMNGAGERAADAIVSGRGVVQAIPRHESAR